MPTIVDFQTKMNAALQDDAAILTTPEKDLFIGQAVKIYSRYRPLEKAGDIAGSGAHTYNLPTGFVDGFSAIKSIEYPQGTQKPEMIPLEDVALYRSPTAIQLRFLKISPVVGKTARVSFTAQHTVDVTTSTIPASDEDAVASMAASLGCQALATHYAQTQDATLSADAVDYKTKSSEYSALAKRLKAIFLESIGVKEDDITVPASGTRDWGSDYQWGEDRMLHPKDQR